jgi:hypothetical protein
MCFGEPVSRDPINREVFIDNKIRFTLVIIFSQKNFWWFLKTVRAD